MRKKERERERERERVGVTGGGGGGGELIISADFHIYYSSLKVIFFFIDFNLSQFPRLMVLVGF